MIRKVILEIEIDTFAYEIIQTIYLDCADDGMHEIQNTIDLSPIDVIEDEILMTHCDGIWRFAAEISSCIGEPLMGRVYPTFKILKSLRDDLESSINKLNKEYSSNIMLDVPNYKILKK